jgi:hypothetical protein
MGADDGDLGRRRMGHWRQSLTDIQRQCFMVLADGSDTAWSGDGLRWSRDDVTPMIERGWLTYDDKEHLYRVSEAGGAWLDELEDELGPLPVRRPSDDPNYYHDQYRLHYWRQWLIDILANDGVVLADGSEIAWCRDGLRWSRDDIEPMIERGWLVYDDHGRVYRVSEAGRSWLAESGKWVDTTLEWDQ